MSNLNSIQVKARLGSDPELKSTRGGWSFYRLNLAINTGYKQKDGNWKDDVCWIDALASDNLASTIQQLRKGDSVIVTGQLKMSSWNDQSGAQRTSHNIKVQTIEKVMTVAQPGRQQNAPQQQGWTNQAPAQAPMQQRQDPYQYSAPPQQAARPAPAQQTQGAARDPSFNVPMPDPNIDDEIPF